MSLDPILWALKDAPVADSTERLVLVVLAERAGRSDGCTSFPSRDTIAQTAMIDPKTVQRVLKRLETRGLIAKGDQSAARYIRADRRPVVWDLLIPFSWFPNCQRMNEERRQAGLQALTPQDRPVIASAPERARRSDVGTTRRKKDDTRGDCESPRSKIHGGTDSPERGDSESRTGGLEDPRTSSVNHPEEPPLCSRPSAPTVATAVAALTEQRAKTTTGATSAEKPETAGAGVEGTDGGRLVQELAQRHGAAEVEIRAVLGDVRREGRIRSVRAWAGSEAGREDIGRRLRERTRAAASRVAPGTLGDAEALDRLAGMDATERVRPGVAGGGAGLEAFRVARAKMKN